MSETLTLVTWNLNSIRARLDRFVSWLDRARPDVVCLQELKVKDSEFPFEELKNIGYEAAIFGQPTYNGVAIVSRRGMPTDVIRGFSDGDPDEQSRFIAAKVAGIRVISGYFPNGSEMTSDKYQYKLRWLDRLHTWLEANASPDEPLALLGDFNIAVDELDAKKPASWQGGVLLNDVLTAHFRRLENWGFVDVVRREHSDGGLYTWWDYRNLSFPRNDGLRIDHILLTAPLAARCRKTWVDREERKGQKPSDHAPVWAELAD